MGNEITAFIPSHIQDFLHSGMAGELILVSSSGIYLRIEEQIVLLCDKDWGILPIGIGIDDFDRMVRLLCPQQGQQVKIVENRMVFTSGTIHLLPQKSSIKTMDNASAQSQIILQAAEELAALRKERGISMLVQPLVLGGEMEDILLQNPYCARTYTYLRKLMIALAQSDSSEIRNCTEKLLGLGLGLTPSADDVLLGMVYVFRALPQKSPAGARLFQECIGQLCDRCTNQISAAYLKAIIAGAPFEQMEQVFQGMCGAQQLDIKKLTQVGSSSGTEMLLGMLIAFHICGYDVSQKEELP